MIWRALQSVHCNAFFSPSNVLVFSSIVLETNETYRLRTFLHFSTGWRPDTSGEEVHERTQPAQPRKWIYCLKTPPLFERRVKDGRRGAQQSRGKLVQRKMHQQSESQNLSKEVKPFPKFVVHYCSNKELRIFFEKRKYKIEWLLWRCLVVVAAYHELLRVHRIYCKLYF